MPKVFEIEGYRGFFFSNEGAPLEPVHIHIQKGMGEAKFWVTPAVTLVEIVEYESFGTISGAGNSRRKSRENSRRLEPPFKL